jgi:transcriptional regulator with XRE-family HTH domain
MLHAAHLRAARALLSWHQDELAKKARIGLATLQRLERGTGVLAAHVSTMVKLQTTLEKAGIRFMFEDDVGGIGVRRKR